jgi:hypothetical protein
MKKLTIVSILVLGPFAAISHADIVTFNGLHGNNGDSFTTYTEGIFTVTPTTGFWQEAHHFGHPVPDIFSQSMSSSITVTSSTTDFTFSSVDLGNANSGTPTYEVQGFFKGSLVLSTNGSLPAGPDLFVTINSPNSSQVIDSLVINYHLGTTTSYNIDNIVGFASPITNVVPEPNSLAAIALSLICMGAYRHLRRAS